jgi:hypothetical protein
MPPGHSFGSTLRTTADKLRFVDKTLAKLTLLTPEGLNPADSFRLLDAIRDLKTRRNAMVPVSRVPAEILSEILMIAVVCDKRSLKSNIQVCGHWRAVALGDSRLWPLAIDYVAENPFWTAEMLLRSKDNPISVTADLLEEVSSRELPLHSTASNMNDNVQLALRSHCPVTHLNLRARIRDVEQIVRQLHLLGSLTSLTLHVVHLCNVPFHLIIQQAMPCLRRLRLGNCSPDWSSPMFQGLTHLEISFDIGDAPPMAALSDALGRLPGLEVLELMNAIPNAPRPVSLPRLQHLDIRMSSLQHIFGGDLERPNMTTDIAPFLNSLSYPAHAEVSIVCWSHHPCADAPVIVEAIAMKCPQSPMGLLFELRDGSLYVRGTCTSGEGASLRRFDSALKMHHVGGTRVDVTTMLQPIVMKFTSSDIISFDLDFIGFYLPPCGVSPNWARIFAASPNIEVLRMRLDPHCGRSLFLLCTLSSEQQLLPHLRKLVLCGINLFHHREGLYEVCSLLRFRYAHHCPIAEVLFNGCRDIPQNVVQELGSHITAEISPQLIFLA